MVQTHIPNIIGVALKSLQKDDCDRQQYVSVIQDRDSFSVSGSPLPSSSTPMPICTMTGLSVVCSTARVANTIPIQPTYITYTRLRLIDIGDPIPTRPEKGRTRGRWAALAATLAGAIRLYTWSSGSPNMKGDSNMHSVASRIISGTSVQDRCPVSAH